MSDQSSAPGGVFSGLKGCMFAGLLAAAAIALVRTIPWEDVFRVIFDLSWKFPVLTWALPAGVLVTLFCAISKGLVKSSSARVLVNLAIPALIVWMIMAFISSIEKGELALGSTVDYASIMQSPPEHLEGLSTISPYSRDMARKMGYVQEGNIWLNAQECAMITKTASPYYRIRLNGVPVEQSTCRNGVNVFEWKHVQ